MCLSTKQALMLCFLCVFTPVLSGCPLGWFGVSCSYQCHCSNDNCDDSGECMPGSKCLSEWFGPACQYQDLFSIAVTSTTPPQALSVLKDQDDETCLNGDSEVITINLNSTYVITWIRVVVKTKDYKHNIMMVFNDVQDLTCNNKYMIDDRTMDLFCDVQILTQNITLKGRDVGYLCSLSISGGRNVALKQTVIQSSDYNSVFVANKAVDGNRNADLIFVQSCTHTAFGDTSPNWKVTFLNYQLVNRYVIFNRDNERPRLNSAQIFSYNADNILMYNGTLPDNDAIIVYSLTSTPHNVSYVKIYAGYKAELILTLCEVEIYGDSICPNNRFGLECTKSCNCENKTETCHVATGGCLSGCAAGFYGDGCQKTCFQGTWGVDCVSQCGVHCINKTCDRIVGTCDMGCEDGYVGNTCDSACPGNTWGTNCSNKCSPECFNKTCNTTNGVCLFGCSPGYTGDNCTVACSNFTWGQNCKYACSGICFESTCNRTNGVCLKGCKDGYSSDNCIIPR